MANLSLVFDLIAKDGASGPFKNVGNAAERAGQQTSKFGTAMSGAFKLASGALIGAGLVEGFKALYGAADESRKITRLTAQVIKTTGGEANVSAKQVGDLAAAIAKKTGVDDEAIQSGENLLLTFTNVRNEVGKGNDIFNQATGLLTDMSVALGQDTTAGAKQLGKALNDPIKGVTSLTKVGVSFTAQQKEQIKTLVESGDTLGAQQVILAELGKEFGGAAEAASTPLGKLQQRVGDLAEEFGGKLTPYVDHAATFLMNDFLPAAGDVANTVGNVLGPALEVAGDAFGAIYDVGKGAVDLFDSLPGPIQLTVGALAASAALKGPVSSLFTTIKGVAETAALKVMFAKDAISGLGGAGGVAKAGLGGLTGFFGGPWGLALTGATVGLSLLTSWLGKTDEASESTKKATQEYADALREANGVINESVRQAAAKAAQDAGLLDVAETLGISLPSVTSAIADQGGALNDLRGRLQEAASAGTYYADANTLAFTEEGQAANDALLALNGIVSGGNDAATSQIQLAAATAAAGDSTGVAAIAAQTLNQELEDTADAASDARQQADLFKLSLDILTGANVSMLEVEGALQDALAGAKDAMDDMGGAVLQANGQLNLQSENGRKASDVLLDVRNSGNQLIATMIQQGATSDQVKAKDAELRQAFVNTAKQMGISEDAAFKLADQILGIPAERETKITADTGQPTAAVGTLQKLIDGLHGRVVSITARAIMPDLNGSASGNGQMGTFALGGEVPGWSPSDRADNVPIWATAGEFMQPRPAVRKYGMGFMEDVRTGRFPVELARAYADGGPIGGAPVSIRAELNTRTYESQMNAYAGQVLKHMEPVTRYIGALAWAKTQVGRPYVWGAAGPGGYDCSGFMSAITNVIRGRSPYSRVGSTASFPWAGFAPGYGLFTIGSTPNAGGGIGHMAGTLLGVGVESTGGVGVRIGGSARGASNGLFGQRAHLAFANGGVIGEPVAGLGLYSGRTYSFGERGPETVTPGLPGRGGLAGLAIEGTLRVENDGLVRIVDGRIVEALDLLDQRARS